MSSRIEVLHLMKVDDLTSDPSATDKRAWDHVNEVARFKMLVCSIQNYSIKPDYDLRTPLQTGPWY